MTTVNVYRRQPPRVVSGSAGVICKAVFNMRAAEDGSRIFNIIAVTGCWAYQDPGTLGKGPESDSTRANDSHPFLGRAGSSDAAPSLQAVQPRPPASAL